MFRHARQDRVDQLTAASAAGDPRAMWGSALYIGGLDDAGTGFPGNALPFLVAVADQVARHGSQRARDLIDHAAAAGHPPAMVVAAIWVTHSDRPRAIELLEQAAAQGDAAAMLDLALLVAPDDPQTAKAWLSRLADQGDDAGMYALSSLLRRDDPQTSDAWLHRAAAAGNVHARSDLAVLASEQGRPLDRRDPPAVDPRLTGVLNPRTPVSRRTRRVASCVRCGGNTVQDLYEFITGRWFGARGPSTAGKTGTRLQFSQCTVCGGFYPVDAPSRQYVASKGGKFFTPPKIAWKERAE
jgi:TPR repeat protein